MKDLSKAKEKLFGKAFAQNEDRDVITDLYDKSGEMFRDSFLGKLSKKAITSDFTKTQRDNLLNTFRVPEHYKAFAQYLTGGTVGNKDITTLPENLKKDIVEVVEEYKYMNVFDRGDYLYSFTEEFCTWVVKGGDYTTRQEV